ncbi:MAG: hypothetical protein PHY28_04085 [Dehalococcoidales bacterium]|nr:hypothetical protein [Dehalococcoidales bacterium]
MKILKGCALALLSFILFLLLVVFGITYSVNQVVLNPHYIVKILNDIDFSQVIQETIAEQSSSGDMPAELQTALIDTLGKMEPVIKERIGIALEDTSAYLKGKGTTPNLKETLGKSFMNSQFVADLLDEVDLSQLVEQTVKEQVNAGEGFSEEVMSSMIAAIDKLEPSLKTQVAAASDPIFKYLLMQTSTIDLKTILRQTVLSNNFMSEVVNSLDFNVMAKDTLTEQIGMAQLPGGINLSSQQIGRVITAIEPSLKAGLANAAGPVADYLVGAKSDFNVSISFSPAIPTLKTVVKEAYMAQLPAELQGLPQADIDTAFEQYFADFQQTIPVTFDLNSDDLGLDTTDQVSTAITEAQNGLTKARNNIDKATLKFGEKLKEVRTYVGLFRIAFICVIGLIVLMIMGIILIHRNVKGVCRNLGIVFFIYGGIMFTGVLIAKNIATQKLGEMDIPQSLQPLPGILLGDITAPLQTVSLVCLIGGVLLIVASFVYLQLRKAQTG